MGTYGALIPTDLQLDYLNKAYNSDRLEKLAQRPDIKAFVALDGDQAVGFALVSLGSPADDPPGAVLRSFYLKPAAQGRGHGRALLQAVKQAARENGAPLLWVAVHQDLKGAREWYERHGFEYDGPAESNIGPQKIRQAVYRMPIPR
jgi:GNAT superfamily N-acetyltransferase